MLEKGERLFTTGDKIERIYFINKGELRALRCLQDGSKAALMRALDGEFFALASLFMPNYPCDAIAARKTELLAFPHSVFIQALETDPLFSSALLKTMAFDIKTQCARVERLRLKRIRDRVVHYLSCESRDGKVDLQIPILAWADELGAEPETLYRVLAELEKENTISRSGRHVELKGFKPTGCNAHMKES